MKESHSIFKLDEKQKALMHQMKQEDASRKEDDRKTKETNSKTQSSKDNKDKDISHLKKKQDKFQGNILKIPAERQRIMEKDQEFQAKKMEREK